MRQEIILLISFGILIILAILIRNYGKTQKKSGYKEGIAAGLGKPCPAMEKLVSGEEYHFVYVFKIGQNRILFIAQNKHSGGSVFYCEINNEIKLTVNREKHRCPRSGTVYRVKSHFPNNLVLETIETRR